MPIVSLLDNDLYKFSMQQAVFKLYPGTNVKYKFKKRSPDIHRFTADAYNVLLAKIHDLNKLVLTNEEYEWLKDACPFFSREYLEFLKLFRFKTDQHVHTKYHPENGELELTIEGTWLETILYEVPLLSLISETYFEVIDTDWSMEQQELQAEKKCSKLLQANVVFSDFGTRRRRNFQTQDLIVSTFSKVSFKFSTTSGSFVGTSNLYLAYKYNLKPVGTVAHEWTMAISVLEKDLLHANRNALHKWIEAYPNEFHVALTDTYGTRAFFDDFDFNLASKYDGIRHDSGDPINFIDLAVDHYRKLKLDPRTKTLVFSDSLTVDRCIEIKTACELKHGPKPVFGIGTHFTNDFRTTSSNLQTKSNSMNIVIKLTECDGQFVVKLSEVPTKHQGDENAVKQALNVFHMK